MCNSAVKMDIVFLIDASGSVGSSNWNKEVKFVTDVANYQLPDTAQIAMVTFGYSIPVRYYFESPSKRTKYNKLSYTHGGTPIISALDTAVWLFNRYHRAGAEKRVFLITDGEPWPNLEQNPCQKLHSLYCPIFRNKANPDKDMKKCPYEKYLADNNISVLVAGVGKAVTRTHLDCLTKNKFPSKFVSIDSFKNLGADKYSALDYFVCPVSVSIAITEVRINYAVTSTPGDVPFIEMKNIGPSDIDLNTDPVTFTGYLSCTLTCVKWKLQFGGSSNCKWKKDSYLVLYDGTGNKKPYCKDCACTKTNGLCNDAFYLDVKHCGASFSTSMKNYNWNLKLKSSDGYDVVRSPKNGYLKNMVDDYSYVNLLETDDQDNWQKSCHPGGTPGDKPLTDCKTCSDKTCRTGGDSSSTCLLVNDKHYCKCNSPYIQPYGYDSCRKITPPRACVAFKKTVRIQGKTITTGVVQWVQSPKLNGMTFTVNVPGKTATVSATRLYHIFANGEADWSKMSTVNVKACVQNVEEGGNVKACSSVTRCNVKTLPPTNSPTKVPTVNYPQAPVCEYIIAKDKKSVKVTWQHFTNAPCAYAVMNDLTNQLDYESSCLPNTQLTHTFALAGNEGTLQFDVAAMVYCGGTTPCPEVYSRGIATPHCVKKTFAPTPAPIDAPTPSPTPAPFTPSNNPTFSPTNSPTRDTAAIKIKSCVVGVKHVIVNGKPNTKFTVNFVPTCLGTCGDITVTPNFVYAPEIKDTKSSFGITNGGTLTFEEYLDVVNERDYRTKVYVYATYQVNGQGRHLGGLDSTGVMCTLNTESPTRGPTSAPTDSPTDKPTKNPVNAPTSAPTSEPTKAPTYGPVTVPMCTYLIHSGPNPKGFVIRFQNAVLNDASPKPDMLEYFVFYSVTTQNQAKSQTVQIGQTVEDRDMKLADGVKMKIFMKGSGREAGGFTTCTRKTPAPTLSPTTASPTPSPTYPDPCVYIDPSTLTDENTACDYTNGDVPFTEGSQWHCSVLESNTNRKTIKVKMTPVNFGLEVSYTWELVLKTDANRLTADSDDVTASGGNNNVVQQAGTMIGMSIPENADADDTKDEWFALKLTGCSVRNRGGHQYSCSLCPVSSSKARKVYLKISAESPEEKLTISSLADLPAWVWIVVGAVLAFIPLVGLLGYRFYNKRKLAEGKAETMALKLDKEQEMDQIDNFGGIDDNISVNPIATGGAMTIATGGEFIAQAITEQKENMEMAKVETEKGNFRQTFGQIVSNKQEVADDNSDST